MDKARPKRIKLPLREAMELVFSYARGKIREQAQSVLPIVLYLLLFQVLVLRVPVQDALVLAFGIGVAILGLAVFLEGLLLGLMPLGEQIGVVMPRKWPLAALLGFALLLGAAATLAEPSIGVLRTAGSTVTPWGAPLLYAMLNRYAPLLVATIAAGVGLATVLGMLRFRFGWSLKPLAIPLAAAATAFTLATLGDPNMASVAGLAWDCGGITTGPVTVPLVLALGIGISRTMGRSETPTSGFGVVTLASVVPVLAVLALGLLLAPRVPAPMSRDAFADPRNLGSVSRLFETEAEAAAAQEAARGFTGTTEEAAPLDASGVLRVLRVSAGTALQAVLPLSLFLILIFFLALREKFVHTDEVILGLGLALVGMAFLLGGIELGLTRLGGQVGRRLPAAYTTMQIEDETRTIRGFSPGMVQRTVQPDGGIRESFLYADGERLTAIPYDASRYDAEQGTYRYTPSRAPLVGADNRLFGIAVVLLFAFFLGYAATLAEPALAALGVTAEELSAGTFRKAALVRAVAVGVGIGIVFGVARLLWRIPLGLLLAPPYLVVAILSLFSTEDFVNIAWDSAGVTTGPVTVPLVVTMGLGIGGQVGVTEGFGILALASVYPILTVLLTGLRAAARERALGGR